MAFLVAGMHHIQRVRSRHDRGNEYAIRCKQSAETPKDLFHSWLQLKAKLVLANRFANLIGVDNLSIMSSYPVEEQLFDRRIVTPHNHPCMTKRIATFRDADRFASRMSRRTACQWQHRD